MQLCRDSKNKWRKSQNYHTINQTTLPIYHEASFLSLNLINGTIVDLAVKIINKDKENPKLSHNQSNNPTLKGSFPIWGINKKNLVTNQVLQYLSPFLRF